MWTDRLLVAQMPSDPNTVGSISELCAFPIREIYRRDDGSQVSNPGGQAGNQRVTLYGPTPEQDITMTLLQFLLDEGKGVRSIEDSRPFFQRKGVSYVVVGWATKQGS